VRIGRNKGRGGWLFLALVVAGYAVTALVEAGKAHAAVVIFVPMLGKVAPVLLVVLALMLLSERFFTPRRVERWLGRVSGPGVWLIAAGAGALATGPVYPWYALLAELRRKGMPPALVAVLLYARAIKLPLLPLMAHYFGAPFTLVLSGWILAFAGLSGLAMRRFATAANAAMEGVLHQCSECRPSRRDTRTVTNAKRRGNTRRCSSARTPCGGPVARWTTSTPFSISWPRRCAPSRSGTCSARCSATPMTTWCSRRQRTPPRPSW
jgi:hypothetical protein